MKSSCRKLALWRHLTVTLLVALTSVSLEAQSPDAAQCYGFSFGTWTPALDLANAGHRPLSSATEQPKAPGGRDWASDVMPNDTTLLLFPTWWPAGIQVTLSRKPRSSADTVSGSAQALVADGRATAPRAPLRAWRVACR